jgi:hypothetical protein
MGLAASPAQAAESAPTDACLDRGAAYVQEQSLQGDVYVACTGDTATVSIVNADGEAKVVATEATEVDGEKQTLNGEPVQAQTFDDGGAGVTSCDIEGEYYVVCEWQIRYSKVNGGVPVWTRTISAMGELFLQSLSHEVKVKFNHDQGKEFEIDGRIIHQNMQGWAPPTLDASFDIYAASWLGTASASGWINRFNTDAAKFSVIFNVDFVYDVAEGRSIPIFGDPTSPRFQCPKYVNGVNDQCEYPDGQEAGVF